jgi:hypothetical protein
MSHPVRSRNSGLESSKHLLDGALTRFRRFFLCNWQVKPRSWYRTFLEEPRGTIQVADREIAVRAVRTRSERLKDAVDRAYLEKYKTPGSIKYAQDLGSEKSRATTTELVPL